MLGLFFQSLIRHFAWWAASLWPGRHEGAPLNVRRLLFLLLLYPAFLGLQCLHWLGFLCDEIFFAAFRKVTVDAPVFILGIPRSGTTFLHRTLATDQSGLTTFSTWEAALAPSISQRKCIGLLRAIDRAIGSPIHRLIVHGLQSASADFDKIHHVGLDAPEEDYLSLLPVGGCFILLLAFPFSTQLLQLGRLKTMPSQHRARLLDFYERAIQRHLYCHPGKRFLSKNAAFSSWAGALRTPFADAKFLICIRDPASALSSQLSSLASARQTFGTDPDGTHTAKQFTELYAHSYQALAEFLSEASPDQVALIEQSDLKEKTAGTIRAALRQLGYPISGHLETTLQQLDSNHSSDHQHQPSDFLIDSDPIEHSMKPAYEEMLRSPNRSQPTAH